jgi:hypothetical protein
MAHSPTHLFTLIEAYAAAAVQRTRMRNAASWAFLAAHRDLHAARAAIATALGVPVAALPPLTDEDSALAEDAETREDAWHATIDAAIGSGS